MKNSKSTIRYICYPKTIPPPEFVHKVVAIFRYHEESIGTQLLDKGLNSDMVMHILSDDLIKLGWKVEIGKRKKEVINRPVFFGEGGVPTLKYQIDGYHEEWKCGIEIEAARAWMGNAIYRDLIQALVMVNVEHLILAVPNVYKYKTNHKDTASNDYSNTVSVAEALYGHSRISLPYGLTIIGYYVNVNQKSGHLLVRN